jgi:hypothetical protein
MRTRILSHHFIPAGLLAACLVVSLPPVNVGNAADAKATIGTTVTGAQIPTTEEARAALMMPNDPNPVLGDQRAEAAIPAAGDKPAAESTALAPGGSAETMGARSGTALEDTRPGPIGATGQTMPSAFSERNAILDRVPIMAMPLALTPQQRQHIYQTVMADTSRQPAPAADSLAPASALSADQAMNEMQSFPQSLQDIQLLNGLRYVKAKDKVLVVRPSTRIVLDQITL